MQDLLLRKGAQQHFKLEIRGSQLLGLRIGEHNPDRIDAPRDRRVEIDGYPDAPPLPGEACQPIRSIDRIQRIGI